MYKYITLFFSVSLFLISCKGGDTPDGIIDQKKMTSLLVEVHLVDGRMFSLLQNQDSINRYGTRRYDALFKRYHTDSVTFKKSLHYYAMTPVQMQKMYDTILNKLKIKSDSLNKVQRKTDSLKKLDYKKLKVS
ncbi:MAG: DUF4296 domain-containing protein [Bacteroidota bacterium]